MNFEKLASFDIVQQYAFGVVYQQLSKNMTEEEFKEKMKDKQFMKKFADEMVKVVNGFSDVLKEEKII